MARTDPDLGRAEVARMDAEGRACLPTPIDGDARVAGRGAGEERLAADDVEVDVDVARRAFAVLDQDGELCLVAAAKDSREDRAHEERLRDAEAGVAAAEPPHGR